MAKYTVLLILFLYSCSNGSEHTAESSNQVKQRSLPYNAQSPGTSIQRNVYVENGQRQGMQYFDPSGAEHNYRYNTITIRNGSTVPIQLTIGPTDASKKITDTLRSQFFILPRKLTPDEQRMDTGGMSPALKQFLDFETGNPWHLSQVIDPGGKCVVTFGFLTDKRLRDPTTPFDTELLTSPENTSEVSLKLKVNSNLIIPCGHFTYLTK
jgi:hypothetical protein